MTNHPSASESGELIEAIKRALASADSASLRMVDGTSAARIERLTHAVLHVLPATQPVAAPKAGGALTDERIYDIAAASDLGIGDDEYEMSKRAAFARAIEREVAAYANQPAPTAAPEPVEPAIPTGEQLYLMVTSRFKQGSLPWAMASESGKAAWSAAAADLIFAPDTIAAKLSRALAAAHQPAQEQASTTRVTETKRAHLEARGYEVVGYVMQNSVNELCTLAHGRVEWLAKPAQAAQQEPVDEDQDGAPTSVDPNVFFDALSDFKDSRMTADDGQAFFDKIAQQEPVAAPQQAAAPVEDADGAALRLALKHNMLIDLGRGGCHVRFGDRTPANSVTELGDRRSATRIAIRRAAQLDGGQEGSES